MHYNFCRIHTPLRVTPAMEAGIAITYGQLQNFWRVRNYKLGPLFAALSMALSLIAALSSTD
jgi:hypothetical protein